MHRELGRGGSVHGWADRYLCDGDRGDDPGSQERRRCSVSETIRECPLCDGGAFVEETSPGRWRIRVNHGVYCALAHPDFPWESEDEAIDAWNRRPREERLVKLLREAQQRLMTCLDGEGNIEFCHIIDAELGRET